MKGSRFKPKRIRLAPQEWIVKFQGILVRQPSYGNVLRRLVREGCEKRAVLEFLQAECYERHPDKKYLRSGLRELYRQRKQLAQNLENIASQIRVMNEKVLLRCENLKTDHFPCIGVNGERISVEASEYNDLPELLRCYVQTIRPRRDPRDLEVHGPELAMLAIYIHKMTGQIQNRSITTLLQAGYECSELKFSSGEQAIAKRIERYRNDHPDACKMIDRVISEYASKPTQDRESVDDFLDRLYDKAYSKEVDDIDKRPPRGTKANRAQKLKTES